MDNLSINQLKNNLRSYRVKQGFTQEDAADKLGVCLSTFKNWERHPEKMSFEKLGVLAEIYKCSVKDFFL